MTIARPSEDFGRLKMIEVLLHRLTEDYSIFEVNQFLLSFYL